MFVVARVSSGRRRRPGPCSAARRAGACAAISGRSCPAAHRLPCARPRGLGAGRIVDGEPGLMPRETNSPLIPACPPCGQSQDHAAAPHDLSAAAGDHHRSERVACCRFTGAAHDAGRAAAPDRADVVAAMDRSARCPPQVAGRWSMVPGDTVADRPVVTRPVYRSHDLRRHDQLLHSTNRRSVNYRTNSQCGVPG